MAVLELVDARDGDLVDEPRQVLAAILDIFEEAWGNFVEQPVIVGPFGESRTENARERVAMESKKAAVAERLQGTDPKLIPRRDTSISY